MSDEAIQKTSFAVLTKKEAAEILKVSPRTVDYLVITNQIPFSRIGKRGVRFSENRLREWFEGQQEGIPFHRKGKADAEGQQS